MREWSTIEGKTAKDVPPVWRYGFRKHRSKKSMLILKTKDLVCVDLENKRLSSLILKTKSLADFRAVLGSRIAMPFLNNPSLFSLSGWDNSHTFWQKIFGLWNEEVAEKFGPRG